MKHNFKIMILMSTLAVCLSACTENDNKGAHDGVQITANDKMDASSLADAGEQLVSPYTWMLADKVFTMALEKNATNEKAQFYRALLKPMMVYKGIGNRLKPFARDFGSIKGLESSIAAFPKSPLRDFLLDGPEDIQSAKQIQDLVIEQREAFNDLRLFLKSHADMEMTLNLNPYIWTQTLTDEAKDNCRVVNNDEHQVKVECDFQNYAIRTMNSADIVVLTQMVSGYVLFYDLYTSYSFEGIETVQQQLEAKNLTPAEKQKILESVPTLGKMRPDAKLTRVLDLGSDFVAAAKWAAQYQNRLCSLGEGKPNRPGAVFKRGICVPDTSDFRSGLALLEQGLHGAINLTMTDKDSHPAQTTLNVAQFLTAPPADLRSVAPSSYCKGGTVAKTLRDQTISGLYVNGDAERFTTGPCRE